MNLKIITMTGLLFIGTAVAFSVFNDRNTHAAESSTTKAQIGRYQFMIDVRQDKFLCDTVTGRIYKATFPGDGTTGEWKEEFVKPVQGNN